MSSSLSSTAEHAIINANYDFEKVIADVADGFKRCRFFNRANWKNMLEVCFDRIRLGLTNEEIQIYLSVMSESSYEDDFANGLKAVSTPYAAAPNQKESRAIRKRSSTTTNDVTSKNTNKRMKMPLVGTKVAHILSNLKNTNWHEIVSGLNVQQNTVEYENVFDKSKQLKTNSTATENVCARKQIDAAASATQAEATSYRDAIKKRRNAIYKPSVKTSTKQPSSSKGADLPVSGAANDDPNLLNVAVRTTRSKTLDLQPTVSTNNDAVATNITGRRMTRRQTKLMAAYSGTAITAITERRTTTIFQRTAVLFTMINVVPFKSILSTFNIFVSETNEKYDYLIAEKIYRSPKFFSAVVAGKPIISIKWIYELKEKKVCLDPLNYLLYDEEGEKEYNFKLSETLQLAADGKLFRQHSILVTPNTTIEPDLLKGIIFSGGGKFLTRRHSNLCFK